MTTSTDNGRVRTTHVGSLPRPQEVVDMLLAEDRDELVDRVEYDAVMCEAVRDAVQRQVDAGIDVVSDGEMSKISYATYIRHRLTGFEPAELPRAAPSDLDAFPSFKARLARDGGTPAYLRPVCRSPIAVKDTAPLLADLDRLTAAMRAAGATDAFMNAPSPATIAIFQPNEHYASQDAYLEAVAEGMRPEYEAIAAAGLTLQVDCPDLALGRHTSYRNASEDEFVAHARRHVEVLNHALRNVPPSAVRIHVCWGNYEGPHTHDVSLRRVVELLLEINAQAVLFEAANPRHAHEWVVWKDIDLSDGRVLIPGCLDTTTNFVEHPELVAERIERFAGVAGRGGIMAGTDCGFGTFAGYGAVDPDICYAKLAALAEGAALATARLAAGADLVS